MARTLNSSFHFLSHYSNITSTYISPIYPINLYKGSRSPVKRWYRVFQKDLKADISHDLRFYITLSPEPAILPLALNPKPLNPKPEALDPKS